MNVKQLTPEMSPEDDEILYEVIFFFFLMKAFMLTIDILRKKQTMFKCFKIIKG